MSRLLTRRSLISAAGALMAPRSGLAALTPAAFRAALAGPICSVPTPYQEDLSIDTAAIGRIVEKGIESGAGAFALTAGNNQYDRLTYDEIKHLTTALIRAVKGRAPVIAATGPWWTGQCVDYAKFATAAGAEAIQVMHPAQGNDETLLTHYKAIAAATPRALVLHGQVPMPLLDKLVAIESVAAYKEEYPALYSVEAFSRYGQRLNIFGGGQKSRYLMYRPFGMTAYYSTFSTFAPAVVRRFWNACQAKDEAAAVTVIRRYDVPFFARFSFAFWRATLAHFGVAQRYLRTPEPAFTAAQTAELATFYRSLGL